MIAKLFSPHGRVTRQYFFYTMLFAAIGQAFLVLGSNDLAARFSRADFFLMIGCATAPFAWVEICAVLKRLHDAAWPWIIAVPMIPACFWPLWNLFRGETPPIGHLVFNILAIYTVVFWLLLSVKMAAGGQGLQSSAVGPAAIPQTGADFDPVVGWLVVIDGPSKGDQYRLHAQRNRIGSDSSMDIRIATSGIERVEHATVTYDPRNNRYSIAPGTGFVAMRTPGMLQPLVQPAALQPYDRICLGDTTLIFVPLCGPHHQWQLAGRP
jgi:uncharacterized membrane protein YhaH (DUF805 family)